MSFFEDKSRPAKQTLADERFPVDRLLAATLPMLVRDVRGLGLGPDVEPQPEEVVEPTRDSRTLARSLAKSRRSACSRGMDSPSSMSSGRRGCRSGRPRRSRPGALCRGKSVDDLPGPLVLLPADRCLVVTGGGDGEEEGLFSAPSRELEHIPELEFFCLCSSSKMVQEESKPSCDSHRR